ncbi:hypothetical protein ACAW74_25675 [Fibrella sp. WM1]|uniref:hypothetical protein n=1 Tax=Fibrella musci TaxID=3242485 RepID=UPI003521F56C
MKRFLVIGTIGATLAVSHLATAAMFKMTHEITIGSHKLSAVESVVVESSTELLADEATITIPAKYLNQALAIESQIKRGDAVTIRLGYDGQNPVRFTGFVTALKPNAPFVIKCQDGAYLLRKGIPDKTFKKCSVRQVLDYVVDQVNKQGEQSLTVVGDAGQMQLDSFTIVSATGIQVLEKLKDLGLALYCKGNEVRCHLRYTEKTGDVRYDFTRNVETSDDLEFVRADDIKVKVEVIGGGKKKKGKAEGGQDGGEKVTLHKPNVSDTATLNKIVKEELKKRSFDGFRGSLKTWLVPFVEVGYTARLADPSYPDRAGAYYVTSVKTEFSSSGGRCTVGLGIKVS